MFVSRIKEFVEQGFLRMKKFTSGENTYYIVNYNEEYKNDEKYAAYKSVILSADEQGEPDHILAFAPPHSVNYDEFKESLQYEMPEEIVANNAIEGTMIQLFYDCRIQKWNIATRASIGGNNWYYGTGTLDKIHKTFRSMFMDCLNGAETLDEAFADWPKTNSYCFVLQHPDNQIVFDVKEPMLYLVAGYRILTNNDGCSSDDIRDWVVGLSIDELNQIVKMNDNSKMIVPQPYTFSRRFDELECVFRDADNCMGVMFWNTKTGQRAHMENSKYNALREIRGNHPNLMFHFLELNRAGKAFAFLEVFPRYTQQFKEYYDMIIYFAYMVYGAYVNYYMKRDRSNVIPKEYFVFAAKIHHEIYVPNKKAGNEVHITPLLVRNYIENVEPIKLVHYLKTMNIDATHM